MASIRTAFLLLTLGCFSAARAGHPVTWAFVLESVTDSSATISLTATCEEGWHLYALTLPSDQGPFPTVIRLDLSAHYAPVAGAIEPAPVEVEDPNFMMLVRYHGHSATFTVPLRRLTKSATDVRGEVEFMCCNDQMCLPPKTEAFSLPMMAVE